MNDATATTIDVSASDTTGQRYAEAKNVPIQEKVEDVVERLLRELDLPLTGSSGERNTYRARLEREGRHLGVQEVVGDALQHQDHLIMHPYVKAGGE